MALESKGGVAGRGTRRAAWTGIAGLALGGFLWLVYLGLTWDMRSAALESAAAFRPVPVVRGNLRATVAATGTMEPYARVVVQSEIPGVVARAHVESGERVTAGQPLVELDSQRLRDRVAQLRASYHWRRALTRVDLVGRARIELAKLTREHQRVAALLAAGISSELDLDHAQHLVSLARIAVGDATAGTEAREAAAEEAAAVYDRARRDLAESVIRSPIDGVVVRRSVEIGTAVADLQNGATVVAVLADDLERLRSGVPSALRIAAEGDAWVSAETPLRTRPTAVSAGSPVLQEIRNHQIARGRYFDGDDARRRSRVAVIGASLPDLFFGGEEPLGRRIQLAGVPYRVIGVLARKGRQLIGVATPKAGFQYTNTDRPDNRLLMPPASAAEARLGYRERAVSTLLLFPRSGVAPDRAISALFRALGPRAGFHPDDADALKWYDSASRLSLVDLFYAGFMAFIGIAGTITLMIGGVGIANYHLATLSERTLEIAVAKAVGARSRSLVAQTILESTLVSAGSAALGVLLGLAACALTALLAPPENFPRPVVSAMAVGVTFAATLGVAVVAAVAPALRVQRIEISTALRATG